MADVVNHNPANKNTYHNPPPCCKRSMSCKGCGDDDIHKVNKGRRFGKTRNKTEPAWLLMLLPGMRKRFSWQPNEHTICVSSNEESIRLNYVIILFLVLLASCCTTGQDRTQDVGWFWGDSEGVGYVGDTVKRLGPLPFGTCSKGFPNEPTGIVTAVTL